MTNTAYVQFFDFLEPGEVETLIASVAETLEQFDSSTIYNASERGVLDEKTRRSKVRMDTTDLDPVFEPRLMSLLPHIRREIGMARFDFGRLEMQLTVHGDGDFFTSHRDENHPGTDDARALTFVYYFNAEPREFEGGELRLSVPSTDGPSEVVELFPASNSIVFFPPHFDHEVRPIRATGSGPGSLRCTVNGWYRIGKGTGAPIPPLNRHTRCELQQALVPRVTSAGFSMRPTPESVQRRLAEFWARCAKEAVPEQSNPDYFPDGSPSYVPVGELGQDLLEELRPFHEQWAGVELVPTAAYGLRDYGRGQTSPLHVDRCESHIITSEIRVDQAVDRPWPLRINVDGDDHDLHLSAGHMVTYEGASCPNGRLLPLDGSSSCSLLLHYRPAEWSTSLRSIVDTAREQGVLDRTGHLLDVVQPHVEANS